MKEVLILGTGKMARDIGVAAALVGYVPTWVSRDSGRLAEVAKVVVRSMRQQARLVGLAPVPITAANFRNRNDAKSFCPAIVIEAVVEELLTKQKAFADIAPALSSDPLILSTSSALLPGAIWPGCIGMHFFYPVALTRFVEIIAPPESLTCKLDATIAFAEALGLVYLRQDYRQAFSANRLLLPLQCEALRLLRQGIPATVVDAGSKSKLFPTGILTLMDSIGLDTVAAAVRLYIEKMTPAARSSYSVLVNGLSDLCEMGKFGQKNQNGFLLGAPLPYSQAPGDEHVAVDFHRHFTLVFLNTCLWFLEHRLLTEMDLQTILTRVYCAEMPFAVALRSEDRQRAAGYLEKLASETGADYLRPCASWIDR